ncbi:glutathione S-transferase kappa 1-like [Mya arenaria]|uniref:glutathione S-transferase kappa 1-like n=1 Tax=Mya arenaria TaxID=6604 RepID=UPI0022E23883|nr:glutathione S-transferase kappa 1-like [Mya arenaria]
MAAPIKKTVELFYDVVSPYSWFAFEVLCRYENIWNLDLKMKPFFLGGIMKAADNTPPAMVPNRGQYMRKDLQRLAKYFNVPLNEPKDPAEMMFVKGSLKTQRFITAVDMKLPSKTRDVTREMWHRNWSRDEDITEPNSLKEAGLKAGLTEEQIATFLQDMSDSRVKDRLKQYTEEALGYKAFGSPTIMAHVDGNGKPELVFGSDRFPVLAQLLGKEWLGPTPPGESKL